MPYAKAARYVPVTFNKKFASKLAGFPDRPTSNSMDSLNQKWLERSDSEMSRLQGEPLVSIFCFCKNRSTTIKRCVDSVLNQTYRNIEFVIQDGASTDGTLKILRSYNDPRIKLVSEPDSGPAEAFWKVLNRCSGDIIGSCLSDEELLPDAVNRAVAYFRAEPQLGAITCDGYVTNPEGRVINEFNAGEFNFVEYLFGWYSPLWVASFFRRQALLEIGLGNNDWNLGCLEFEIWCRLATQHEVKYFPVRMAHYSVNPTQLSNTPQAFREHFESRATLIRRMFSKEGFFGENDILLKGCLYNQLYLLYNHVRAYKLADQAALLATRMHQLLNELSISDRIRFLRYFPRLKSARGPGGDISRFLPLADRIWLRVALRIPASVRQRVPRHVKDNLRTALIAAVLLPLNIRAVLSIASKSRFRSSIGKLPIPSISPNLYNEVAQIFYGRGQINQALKLWWRAEEMNDSTVDGVACQAMLMSPSATNESLLAAQKQWAARHALPANSLNTGGWKRLDGYRRIRVGYFCSFLDTDTIRFQLMPALRHRNREKFEVYGYSPSRASSDIVAGFDQFRATGVITDKAFIRLVQSDEIDVLVELSGFSPQHRFAAMAARCAPVQVSYLNHTGTSGVPNVDYVLADNVCVLPEEDRFFTEKVWRLPGSFFCFDYDSANAPEVAPPPSTSNGFITFCCFGSGGKINRQLIELWSAIINSVPDSLLLIRNSQASRADNRRYLQDRFRYYGIPAERLKILRGTDRRGILKCYADADISLDTWPYCGGNTIAESIWQGVPVITLKGNRFSSRYGSSLIMAAGCPELVAGTPEQYVDLAVRLTQSPDRLNYYRANLRNMARKHGLGDAKRFASNLESAYIEMLRNAGIQTH